MSRLATSLLILAVVSALAAGEPPVGPLSIDDLAWLAGDWQTADDGRLRTDEHWTAPLGGAMLGTSRTLRDGTLVSFEYLRIVEREDGIVYIAHPGARAPGTEFKLTSSAPGEAVFENPEHDFPKRIVYRRNEDGSLTATTDAGAGTKGPVFHYRPMGRPGA